MFVMPDLRSFNVLLTYVQTGPTLNIELVLKYMKGIRALGKDRQGHFTVDWEFKIYWLDIGVRVGLALN